MDGWVFELPTSDAQLVAVLAAFRVGNGDPGDGQYQVAVISKPGFANPDATGAGRQYPSGIVTTGGTSKAWLQTPHDSRYELSYGEASLNGETVAKFFTITHTCPAGFTSSSAVVSAGNGGNVTTVATQDPDPGENEGASGGEPGAELGSTNTPTPDPENTGDGDGESESGSTSAPASPSVAAEAATQDMLPITGAAIGGMILGGLFMVLLGAVLVAVRRRRKSIQFQA